MDRRTYLGSVSAALAAAGTTGCTSLLEVGALPDAPGELPWRNDSTSEPSSTVQTVTIGSREAVEDPDSNRPHHVRLWNAATISRSIAVAISNEAGAPEYRTTVSVPGDAAFVIALAEPNSYEVSLAVGETTQRATIEVPEHWFDCNASSFTARIPRTGEVTVTESSTLLACGSGSERSGASQ